MFFGGDPFEHFSQGGQHHSLHRSNQNIDTTKLYETLGISKDSDEKTIKKAYRKLAAKHHPDKGGDSEKFKEISAAYEILSDKEKRAKYDKYGLEGVSDDAGHGSGDDLFNMFFGRRPSVRKGPNVTHKLTVSLEDLYNGKTVKMAVKRKVIIGEAKSCVKCHGQGAVMEIRQIGPGMISQMQRTCAECSGQGHVAKTKQEKKVLEVHIDKGMKHNEKITFREMADEHPNLETGDVQFIIQEKEHELFKRKGADLLIVKELSLNQALTGFKFIITHLDKRQVCIRSKAGEVIKPKSIDNTNPFVKMVPEEGMPSRGNPFVKGNLYVLFKITFPNDGQLSPTVCSILKKALPLDEEVVFEDDEYDPEVVHLNQGSLRQYGHGGAAQYNSTYDSDEEDGRPVQCQQS